jgi:hypothetical protein
VFSFIVRSDNVEQVLYNDYGRLGLCLKVWRRKATPLETFCWSEKTGVLLVDATKAQNLFARHGFAPRVYDIVRVNGRWAQVTDFVTDNGRTFDRTAAREVVRRYGIACRGGDMNDANWLGDQMVDFQAHLLKPRYIDDLKQRIVKNTAWGSRSDPYQDVAHLTEQSQRYTPHRVKAMAWDDYDWHGKGVLDLGCNLGALCIEATVRGARRVVGVDLPHVAAVAYEVANWLGYWNIDYEGLQLPREKDELQEQFDVVLCLSCKQLKPVPWAFELCREVCWFEGHVPDKEHTHRATLEEHFERVEFLGATTDHGPRPLFRCSK